MKPTIVIAGAGPSAVQHEWHSDVPIMAVSGGYRYVPRMDHFASLDKVMCFPEWMTNSTRCIKHVPDWSNESEWLKCPQVHSWQYEEGDAPNFVTGPIRAGTLRKSNVDDTWHNSLLFAVQVAPRLGFERLVFVGVDLLGPLVVVSDYLQRWYPIAAREGIEWVNASPLSTLCEWMPEAETAVLA